MKKKIGLACALLHAPRLLVLDEPFEAVDPVSAALIRDILHRYVRGGGTVVFSSHVMEVVEKLCTHVAILADGRDQGGRPAGAGAGRPRPGGRLRRGRRRAYRHRHTSCRGCDPGAGRTGHRATRPPANRASRGPATSSGSSSGCSATACARRPWRIVPSSSQRPGRALVRPRWPIARADAVSAFGAAEAGYVVAVLVRWPSSSLAWTLVPLLFFGVDETLDPARFALLPLPPDDAGPGHARGRVRRRARR